MALTHQQTEYLVGAAVLGGAVYYYTKSHQPTVTATPTHTAIHTTTQRSARHVTRAVTASRSTPHVTAPSPQTSTSTAARSTVTPSTLSLTQALNRITARVSLTYWNQRIRPGALNGQSSRLFLHANHAQTTARQISHTTSLPICVWRYDLQVVTPNDTGSHTGWLVTGGAFAPADAASYHATLEAIYQNGTNRTAAYIQPVPTPDPTYRLAVTVDNLITNEQADPSGFSGQVYPVLARVTVAVTHHHQPVSRTTVYMFSGSQQSLSHAVPGAPVLMGSPYRTQKVIQCGSNGTATAYTPSADYSQYVAFVYQDPHGGRHIVWVDQSLYRESQFPYSELLSIRPRVHHTATSTT